MFVRACKLTSANRGPDTELLRDVQELRGALEAELRIVSEAASGDVPWAAGAALWLGSEEAEAAASALRPKLSNAQRAIEALLIEVVTLEVRAPGPLLASAQSSCLLQTCYDHSRSCTTLRKIKGNVHACLHCLRALSGGGVAGRWPWTQTARLAPWTWCSCCPAAGANSSRTRSPPRGHYQTHGARAGANAGEAAPKVLLSEERLEPLSLADLFSERWTALVRSAPMDDVRGMGTRPLKNPITPPKFGLNLP